MLRVYIYSWNFIIAGAGAAERREAYYLGTWQRAFGTSSDRLPDEVGTPLLL